MKPLYVPSTFPIKNNQFQKNDTLINTGINFIRAAKPMIVNTYSELMDMVSKLAYFNRRYVLFFRGQDKEYRIGDRFPTIYPNFFREMLFHKGTEKQIKENLEKKQEELKLKNHNRNPRFHGAYSIWESLHVRWALLQHYQICPTPLIDLTQSLHVAVSFALEDSNLNENKLKTGVIYVLALPWPAKNYHNNKEEDIYLVRLAGISPPQAKRPYRQEAFAAMSQDVDNEEIYDFEKHNFANRMICKFEINNSPEFLGDIIKPLPEKFLAPDDDIFYNFMKNELNAESSTR
jgi:hypothetical protein